MVRDYSDKKREQLKKEIDNINNETWNPVTDGIGDALLWLGKIAHILDLKKNIQGVSSYQKSILDMNDMKKKDIDKIFENVKKTDGHYSGEIKKITGRVEDYNTKIERLIEMIHPENLTLEPAAQIKKELSDINRKLKEKDENIDKSYKKELDNVSKDMKKRVLQNVVSSFVSPVVDVVSMPAKMIAHVATGNYKGIISDTWGLINDVFSVGGNLVALGALGLYSLPFKYNSSQKERLLDNMESYTGTTGLADTLEAKEKTEGKDPTINKIKNASQVIDTVDDAYGIVGDAKKILNNPLELKDNGTKHNVLMKKDMLENYQKDYRKWQKFYNKYEIESIKVNKVKRAYKYLESGYNIYKDDGNAENIGGYVVKDNFLLPNVISDTYDYVVDRSNEIINVY